MDLQSTYYVTSIIFMIVMLGVMIAIAVVIFYIKNKVEEIQLLIKQKINTVSSMIEHPEAAVARAGGSILKSLLNRFIK